MVRGRGGKGREGETEKRRREEGGNKVGGEGVWVRQKVVGAR